MINLIKNIYYTLFWHYPSPIGPKTLPDEFIRYRIRCVECNEECDVVHCPPNKSSCADGYYCYRHEPFTLPKGWVRRAIL